MALEMLVDILTRMASRCSIHISRKVAIGQKVTGRSEAVRFLAARPREGGRPISVVAWLADRRDCESAATEDDGTKDGFLFRPHHFRQHLRARCALLLLQVAVLVLVENRRRG